MKKLDDAELVKMDIVNRPEVTPGVDGDTIKPNEKEAPRSDHELGAQDIDRAERQSRIFSRRVERLLKGMTGDDVTNDEKAEVAEIGGMVFKGLLKVPFGNLIGTGIIAVCVAFAFLPRILKFTAGKPEECNNG